MKPHFMVGETDGALFDTRAVDWHKLPPLRPVFRRHFSRVQTVEQFKATLRAGPWAWPGGYALYLITSDGGALCFDCARAEARNVMDSIQTGTSDGWRVVGCQMESDCLVICDHCAAQIVGENHAG